MNSFKKCINLLLFNKGILGGIYTGFFFWKRE